MNPKITREMTGIWLPRENGWRNGYLLPFLASGYGLPLTEQVQGAISRYMHFHLNGVPIHQTKEYDRIHDLLESIGEQANDHLQRLAPQKCKFVWDDNELSLRWTP